MSSMKMYNVLIFPGGTEIGLEIYRSLAYSKDIKLFAAGVSETNHGMFAFEEYFSLPTVDEEGWIKKLNEIIDKNNIDFIYPAHDSILKALAENSKFVEAKIISSPSKTCTLTRSKRKTINLLKGIIPTPEIYDSDQKIKRWPIFLKPDVGQGSQGTYLAKNSVELEFYINQDPSLLAMEYLPGSEFTIDCFTHRNQGLLFASGRVRARTRNGISMNSRPVK